MSAHFKNEGNVYVPVEISEGLFSNEYAVTLKLANGTNVTLYADKYLINNIRGKHFLKVTLVKENEKTVLLPSEAFETSTRWATVPELRFT